MTDRECITAKVNQVRRRLFLLLLANFMAVAACGAVLVAVLAGFPNATARGPVVLAAVVFALTAGLLAILRTPSGSATAERIDRRLGLQQRLETAWECRLSHDELDLLLLRDAAQRLHYVQTSVVAPMHLSRVTKICLLTGVLLVLGAGIFRVLDGSNRGDVLPVEGRAQAGQGSPPTDEAGKTTASVSTSQKPGRADPRNPDTPGSSSELAGRASQLPGTAQDVSLLFPGQDPPSSMAADKGASADRPVDSQWRADASSAAGNPLSGASPQDRRTAPGSEVPVPPPGRTPDALSSGAASPGSTAGVDSIRRSLQPALASPAGQSSGRGGGSSGGGAGTAARPAQGRESSRASNADAEFFARYARRYPATGPGPEAVQANQAIPPGMRQYIAAYFAALHR